MAPDITDEDRARDRKLIEEARERGERQALERAETWKTGAADRARRRADDREYRDSRRRERLALFQTPSARVRDFREGADG